MSFGNDLESEFRFSWVLFDWFHGFQRPTLSLLWYFQSTNASAETASNTAKRSRKKKVRVVLMEFGYS